MRKLSLFVVFSIIISLIAGCSSGEPSEEEFATVEPSIEVVDPNTIEEDLIGFLDWFGWYSLSGNSVFDSDNINENSNVMNIAFTHCVDFDSYPGEEAKRFQKDPSGKLNDCDIFEESKTDWILTNIFHYSDEDLETIKSTSSDQYYLDGGYYYVKTGGVGGGYNSKPIYAWKDGDLLKLIFAQYQGDVMMSLSGMKYAVVSKADIDGNSYWTLHYWSNEIPSGSLQEDLAIEGNWSVSDDASKSLVIDAVQNNTLPIHVTLEKGAGFSADALVQEDGKTAVFADINTQYAGWLEFQEKSIVLHVFTDTMDEQSFTFKKADTISPTQSEEPFSITGEELESWIAFIRECYYTPGSADTKIVLENGTDGWNYSREYYYHDGQFIFAFIYNGTEEHRLYFKDNHMIRYIDESHTTFDYPNLEAFADWEKRALEEALKYTTSEPSAWKGTWKADDGEYIEINDVSNQGFTMNYTGYKADGSSMFHADHEMAYTDSSCLKAEETDQSAADMSWRYSVTLNGNILILSSRYPDKTFYRQ